MTEPMHEEAPPSGPAGPEGEEEAPYVPAPLPAVRQPDMPFYIPTPEEIRQDDITRQRAAWIVPVVAFLFTVGVWWGTTMMSGRPAVPVPTRAYDMTAELFALYRAFQGPGVMHVASPDREVLATWIGEHVGTRLTVPDLAAAGLLPRGARTLNFGGGGLGMILYRTALGDLAALDGGIDPNVLLAVFSPPKRIAAPAHATRHDVNGHEVWLYRSEGTGFAYFTLNGLDWALISGAPDDVLLAAAARMAAS